MSTLDILAVHAPPWFENPVRTADGLVGVVRTGRWSDPGVALRISDQAMPRVREVRPGTCFPGRCSERHIEYGGNFCLGVNLKPPSSPRLARHWWSWLEQFLYCQRIADRTRVWPLAHGLDHGNAGEYHRRALRLAEKLGVLELYLEAYLGRPSWFTGAGLAKLGDRGSRLTGQNPLRPPKVRGRRAKLRLLEIVILERARRKARAAFERGAKLSLEPCCGTMRDCVRPAANDRAATAEAA